MIAASFLLAAALFAPPQAPAPSASQSAPLEALKSEPDKARRGERGLALGEDEFDLARKAYSDGNIAEGDEHLDVMIKALNESTASFSAANKKRLFKRAELRVANLQRRMQSLLDEISIEQRGWAEQTSRQLATIHDTLLEGALRK